jgi:hypothetical protein
MNMFDGFYQLKLNTYKAFSTWGSATLSIALLVAAAVIVFIALQPDHVALKAIILAYVVLP